MQISGNLVKVVETGFFVRKITLNKHAWKVAIDNFIIQNIVQNYT